MKILAIDYGSKRIGLALTDEKAMLARGFKTLENNSDLLNKLMEIIKENDVRTVVLGNPKNMDGSLSNQSREVLRFSKLLAQKISPLEVILFDELLSTEEANEIMSFLKTKKKKRKEIRDQIAAEIILRRYLATQ